VPQPPPARALRGGPRLTPTRLVLIRHGESRASVDEIVGGHEGCRGLSDRGRRQVEALRDRLAATGEVRADALLASVLPRAIETAEILAPALGGLPVDQDCDLCEQHPGEGDGLAWAEFQAKYRPEGWRFDPYEPMAPGGESVAEFNARVARALTKVAAEHRGGTVVVACHGGVVAASMISFLGLPFQGGLVQLFSDNTSLTEWVLGDEDRDHPPPWRLVRYNDAAHLAGVD
jgi:2,3-bisphosphoglycerate-dependent phosphoglycerate mutase